MSEFLKALKEIFFAARRVTKKPSALRHIALFKRLEIIISKVVRFVGSRISGLDGNHGAVRPAIFRPPGTISILLFRTIYPKKKFEQVFQQQIADMREEYYAALMLGRAKHARWIWIRGVACLWLTVLADVPVSISKLVVHLWKASQ